MAYFAVLQSRLFEKSMVYTMQQVLPCFDLNVNREVLFIEVFLSAIACFKNWCYQKMLVTKKSAPKIDILQCKKDWEMTPTKLSL